MPPRPGRIVAVQVEIAIQFTAAVVGQEIVGLVPVDAAYAIFRIKADF